MKIGRGSRNGAQSKAIRVRKSVKESWALERVVFQEQEDGRNDGPE
jgi:hypothetical protein